MSAQEFLRWEAEQEERYELVDGEVFGMTGGTYAHDRTRTNLSAALLSHLRGTPCRVVGPEVKLRVDQETPGFILTLSRYAARLTRAHPKSRKRN